MRTRVIAMLIAGAMYARDPETREMVDMEEASENLYYITDALDMTDDQKSSLYASLMDKLEDDMKFSTVWAMVERALLQVQYPAFFSAMEVAAS